MFMKKGTTKLLLALTVVTAFATSAFATTLISLAPRETGDNLMSGAGSIDHASPGDGSNILVATSGVWTFNTNGTAAPWSTTTNWSGGVIADGGGVADFSTINITGARNPDIDTTSRTVRRLDIGDTDALQSYTISASGGASLIFDNTANSANAQLNQTSGSHGDTISAPMVLNSSLDVTNASATQTLTLSGVISGVGALNSASGTVALGGSLNTYGGGTTISGGKITITGSGTPLGSGSTLTLSGGTLAASASRSAGSALAMSVVVTADSAITTTSAAATNTQRFTGTLTGTGGTLTLRNDAASTTNLFDVIFSGGDYTMSRPIVLDNGAGGGTVRFSDFGASGTTHTYSGVISGTGAFNRSVSSGTGGTTIFTEANTYGGGTAVNSGTLLVNNTTGSGTGTGAVAVNQGTLGGTGSVSGAVTIGDSVIGAAIISPGASVGTFTTTSTLSIASDGSYKFELNSNTSTADKIVAAGVSLNSSSTISLADLGSTVLTLGTSFTIIDNTSATAITGTFSNLADAQIVAIGVNFFEADYQGGTGNDLTLTVVVPEPTTIAMTLFGAGMLVGVQRFRRRTR
jgi:autotransporter-associated beta strand protein